MSETSLEKYVQRASPQKGLERDEIVDESTSFGVLRGARDRSPSIELRRKTGSVLVIGYSWIETMVFDPTDGVTIKIGNRLVRLKGRNLGAELRPNVRLITALAAHKVSWVQEMGINELVTISVDTPVVEAIEW